MVRDGEVLEIDVGEIVLDDLLELRTGDQVPADGTVTDSSGLEIDESLLTGEAEAVDKSVDDRALSGSFVVAGSGRMQTTAVGARLLRPPARDRGPSLHGDPVGARGRRQPDPEVRDLVDPRRRSHPVRPRAPGDGDISNAITGAVAGVVGMVPEGLVLLTSVAFGVAVIVLARRKVLVQELPAVEGLARVDVVCVDKTGTLTEGSIAFDRLQPLGTHDDAEAESALGALAADENANATLEAIGAVFSDPGWTRVGAVPFSSARKWSAAAFAGRGELGDRCARDDLVGRDESRCARVADELAETGSRTLLLAHSEHPLDGETLPAELDAVALVLFDEQVRPDAAETLEYFRSQGVVAEGHLRRQSAHGRGGCPARGPRRRGNPWTPGSCPTTPRRSPRPWRRIRCSGG